LTGDRRPPDTATLWTRSPARLGGPALLAALPMLIAGLFLPSLHLVTLGLFSQEYSLAAAILTFWDKGHYSLFVLLLAFTVLFPLAKILAGLWLVYAVRPGPRQYRRWAGPLAALSKWSMLDVFIVAIAVLAIEGSLLTAASLGAGIALFAGSVILTGWAYGRLAGQPADPPSGQSEEKSR
jgi:paraquat-inducible protein A